MASMGKWYLYNMLLEISDMRPYGEFQSMFLANNIITYGDGISYLSINLAYT